MSTSFIYRDPFTHTKHQVSAPDAATYVVVKNNGEKKSDSDVLGFFDDYDGAREAVMAELNKELQQPTGDREVREIGIAFLRDLVAHYPARIRRWSATCFSTLWSSSLLPPTRVSVAVLNPVLRRHVDDAHVGK